MRAATIEVGLIVIGVLLFAFGLRFSLGSDGAYRYDMVKALVDDHRIAAPPPSPAHGNGERRGARNAPSIVQPLFAAPLYWIGERLHEPERPVRRFSLLAFAVTMLIAYRRLRHDVEPSLLRRWFLVMLGCSMFPHHLAWFFPEVFSAGAVLVSLTCVVTNAPIAAAFAMGLAVTNTPALLVPAGLAGLKLAFDDRKARWLLLPACGVIGILGENWIRRGGPFITGYEGNRGFTTLLPYSGLPGFSFPFALGVVSILFSFGKGLLFFTPGLALSGTEPPEAPGAMPINRLKELLFIVVAGMVIVYAKWWAWNGGWFWGPRFFLLASATASLVLADRLARPFESVRMNLVLAGVLVLSTWVAIDGATFGQEGLQQLALSNNSALEWVVWYVPQFSPLWYPLVRHRPMGPIDWMLVAYCVATASWVSRNLVRRLGEQIASWTR